jgi:predicted Rossmann-fold nucleotide-binding protein
VLRRLPIIGLFGSGTKLTPERAALARDVGILVARLGAHLLTGASYAVTEAAAEGFTSVARRRGVCIGAIARDATGAFDKANSGSDGTPYPNRYVELAVFTTVPNVEKAQECTTRNQLNVLTSNAIIALPGSVGTRNELQAAATCNGEAAKSPAERRTVLVGPAEEFSHELRELFVQMPNVGAAEAHVCHVLSAQGFMVEKLPG